MDRRALLLGHGEDSEWESLSDSFVYSEAESLVESVGSVQIPGCSEPKPSLEVGFPRRRPKKGGAQFMHFFKELPDVPVQKAWEFVRNHKLMASVVPGIIEGFDFVEGEGGTGSLYIATYNPQSVKPGEDKFLINKIEVADDESKLFAVRCVGGKYMKRYNLYITYVNVLPDEVAGDSSSVVIWRFEYEMINPNNPPPEDTKVAYLAAMDMIRDRHFAMNRVERPLVSQAVVVHVTKRLRVRAGQQRLMCDDDQQEPEERPQQHRRRMGKVEQSRGKDDEGSDRESKLKQRPMRKATKKFQAGGNGLLFRRRPPHLSQQLFIVDSTDVKCKTLNEPFRA